ncbi:MAG TPA: PASTA domain-containing protein [Candidatus Latescibacteria bacterium]|nr:PASTA domain-containing protein [Candidatus Latescibacterota bacterium]
MTPKICRKRLLLVAAFLWGCWGTLAARLVQVQVGGRDLYTARLERQSKRRISIPARRGRILDRKGVPLALDLEGFSYFVVAPAKQPFRIARIFSDMGGWTYGTLLTKLRGKGFVWLARKVGEEEALKIRKWKLPDVQEIRELRRRYPMGSLAGQVLGYTDVDGQGIEGAELAFDHYLMGEPGWALCRVDGRGRRIPEVDLPEKSPRDGADVRLTLDIEIQSIVEEELAATVERHRARSGVGVVMVPRTGEVLALAHVPKFDPNHPEGGPMWARRNRAITDIYEPGSTFKIVTAAAALGEGVISPDDSVFCEEGALPVAGTTFRDAHPYGWLSFREVVEFSSNIGIIKVARRLGGDRLYRYARAFGFGAETGVGLQGEVKGILKPPSTWSGLSLASIAVGQEVSVTALQMACAYAAVANWGVLMRAQVALEVVGPGGEVLWRMRPEPIRRVISEGTARKLVELLEGVVERGTGGEAMVPGVRVAGKTGTAQRPREGRKGYAPGEFVASFVGFLPAESPELLCLVVIDTPRKGGYYGGQVAAPVFRRIMERVLALPSHPFSRRVQELLEEGRVPRTVSVPDVRGLPPDEAMQILGEVGVKGEVQGVGGVVVRQYPEPSSTVPEGGRVVLTLGGEGRPERRLPNLRGLTLREAIRRLKLLGVEVRVYGSGRVRRQSPEPGSMVREGMICTIEGYER